MFWAFVLIAALAVVFVQLGAYSVWIAVLSIALKVALVALCGLAIALIWRWAFKARRY